MVISELQALAEARPVQAEYKDGPIAGGYTSDLLSDVMAHARTGDVLITIQAHKNTVAVAGLVGAPAIVLCNDRPIPDDMVEAAREEGIALFSTLLSQFEVSGRLWKALKV